jgi:hypothetical protein
MRIEITEAGSNNQLFLVKTIVKSFESLGVVGLDVFMSLDDLVHGHVLCIVYPD